MKKKMLFIKMLKYEKKTDFDNKAMRIKFSIECFNILNLFIVLFKLNIE